MPRISVVIPCFQAGAFLYRSVESALNQTEGYRPVEVIVVNDSSTDPATLEALASIQLKPNVKVLQNEGPQGSAAARNTGVRNATGEWIAFLDADDWWPEDSLKKRFDALERFPDADWIGGDFLELNRDGTWENEGRFERNIDTYWFLRPAFYPGKNPVKLLHPLDNFLVQAPAHTIVTLLRKRLFEEVGGFNEVLLRQQDYHLFLRLAHYSSFVFVPEIVAYYRLHDNNSTRSLTHTQVWRIKAIQDLITMPMFAPVKQKLKAKIFALHVSNSYIYRLENLFSSAARCAWGAILTNPRSMLGWRTLFAAALKRR